ncbi:hypothetical protein BC332_28198 [Capsicum chinense]|nr:hypothetical protein BC332_28198 [Capsicum chinense]
MELQKASPLEIMYKALEKFRDYIAIALRTQLSDVETMKQKFAKLLLGEDVTGEIKEFSTVLALSNTITSLAAAQLLLLYQYVTLH